MSNVLNGVLGSDRVSPIWDQAAQWQVRNLRDIFVPGGAGAGRVVPNVNDLIFDVFGDTVYNTQRVTYVDLVTGKSTMIPWGNVPTGIISEKDLLTGVHDTPDPNTFVLNVDKNITPYTCLVDGRLYFPNPEITSVKVIRGSANLQNPEVVSLYYDNSGNLLGTAVPTREVALNNNSTAGGVARAKYIPTFSTLTDLEDNEVVTVIGYSAAGHVAMRRQLRVYNTGWLAPRNNAERHVTHVSLDTPFMSEIPDSNLIQLPVNVPLNGLYMRGIVHYSDGTRQEYPVDGRRFTLLGLRDYVATAENIQVPLQLRYTLGTDEVCYDAVVSGNQRFKMESYRVLTMPVVGAYNVKLYCYPEWIDATQGYSLRFFLYSAERDLMQDVTQYVEWSLNSEPFRPKLYGVQQNLSVAVNLGQISSAYVNFRFHTTIQMVLWRQGTEKQTNWTIFFTPGQDPAFGDDNHAKLKFINSNYYLLKLDSGCADIHQWLDRLYWRTKPVWNRFTEVDAPRPTHFRVRYGSNVSEYPLNEWDKTHQILSGLGYWKTVYIEWIAKTPDSELELGITGLPLWEDQTLVIPVGG